MATEGKADRILFPHITPAADPALLDHGRQLAEGDFFTAGTEDRCPSVSNLTLAEADSRRVMPEVLTQALNSLPRHQITLGHDVKANTDFLAELTDH